MSLRDEAVARAEDRLKIDALVTDARIKWEKSQRLERIATAVLAGMLDERAEYYSYEYICQRAVECARILIAELDKEEPK